MKKRFASFALHLLHHVIYGKGMRKQDKTGERGTKLRKANIKPSITAMLEALGYELKGELKDTPARVSALWTQTLLAGEGKDPAQILQRRMKTKKSAPVLVTNIGMHLVCPHHLSVAFGQTHIAYLPADHIIGFGVLSHLVEACCAKLTLQENAAQDICSALVNLLPAKAAVCSIKAAHPCHRLLHPRAHQSHAITWAEAGTKSAAKELRALLKSSL
jgi:GTP cyclohydrolase I